MKRSLLRTPLLVAALGLGLATTSGTALASGTGLHFDDAANDARTPPTQWGPGTYVSTADLLGYDLSLTSDGLVFSTTGAALDTSGKVTTTFRAYLYSDNARTVPFIVTGTSAGFSGTFRSSVTYDDTGTDPNSEEPGEPTYAVNATFSGLVPVYDAAAKRLTVTLPLDQVQAAVTTLRGTPLTTADRVLASADTEVTVPGFLLRPAATARDTAGQQGYVFAPLSG